MDSIGYIWMQVTNDPVLVIGLSVALGLGVYMAIASSINGD